MNAIEKFRNALRTTSIEVVIGGLIGATAVGLFAHNAEYKRENKIPLGFSEISQIERDAEYSGKKVGPMTRYLTSVNDAVMKIFECWNIAHENAWGDKKAIFARELEYKIDPALKIHHYELNDFLEALPEQAKAAKNQLRDFIKVRDKISKVNSHFDNSWDESHIDHYRTETYTDGEGNVHTRMVYMNTTHSYYYNKDSGEQASQSLDNLLEEQKTLELKEPMFIASQTNAEGEYAAETSRELKEERIRLDNKTLLDIASTWKKGSTLMANLPAIYKLWNNLSADANNWRTAKNTAESTSYITPCSSDSGPEEFQVAERTLNHGRNIYASINEILEGIDYVQKNAPVLEKKVKDFIAVTLDGKEGNGKKLSKEIRSLAKEFYNLNFKKGFDVKGYRGYMIFLAALAGLLGGGLLGFGVDQLADKYDWWDKESHKVERIYKRMTS